MRPIGIYVSLFASSTLADLGVILSIFFLLIGVWCYVAYQLTRAPAYVRPKHICVSAPT